MNPIRLALLSLLLALPLAACAGESDGDRDAAPQAPAAQQDAAAAPENTETAAPEDGDVAGADAPVTLAQNEQTQAEPEGDFRAGRDYAVVEPAQPTENPGKIEVMEIFWYGCPHCYDLEPVLQEWVDNKPDDVAFVRLPAVLNRQWETHARAFYTAEALGVLDETHKPLFDALHKENRRLNDSEQLGQFFAEHGVSAETYQSTASSFAVENKLRRAAAIPRRYGISGVPAVIVNGKYRIDARMARSWDHFIDTIEYLVAKERQAMGGGTEAGAGSG